MKQGTLNSFLNIKKERKVPENLCLHYDMHVSFDTSNTTLVKTTNIKFENSTSEEIFFDAVFRSITSFFPFYSIDNDANYLDILLLWEISIVY